MAATGDSAGMITGSKMMCLKPGCVRVGPEAGDRLEQPLAHRAVGVVVVGVHLRVEGLAVLADGVPAFPDGGCAGLHLVQPAGQALLEEDCRGKIELADLDQRRKQGGRADEAGADAAVRRGRSPP